ncbi:PaaI family thioesterase [Actinomadura sp. LD22]|uniref:Acyl-coenzyme A thioesterase THEM4 n=1 Tax=Actinomadura physcomitrii TaxID=2650748 RepID=A0A6I4M5E4_9ACTN|nr:PaaI family thioesterase [Actinomadura physcomitrii]MVZ99503.1 PaaI family thioesterase [Actinomadura physcomitrii]
MSGAMTERHTLGEDEAAPLAGLAARVRELIEAAVLTDVGRDEARAVADEIAALTERLRAVRRDAPPFLVTGAHRIDRQAGNPVSGPLNPVAPPVDLDATADGIVRGEFTLNDVYEGPPSYVHGGVSAMVLDQALGMAAAQTGVGGMTATLELRYRRPTPLGMPLTVEAKASRVEGRKIYASGTITGPDGRVTVEATAMFVTPQNFLVQER